MGNIISNKDNWLEVTLETNCDASVDLIESILFLSGALSVTLLSKEDTENLIEPSPGEIPLWDEEILLTGLFPKGSSDVSTLLLIQSFFSEELCKLSQKNIPLPIVNYHYVPDKEWELEWAKDLKPLVFGSANNKKRLWVCPSTHKKESLPRKDIVLDLDPGLAFGTGTHSTTKMVLNNLVDRIDIYLKKSTDRYVIDYGCGSGILGIAAVKLGANEVLLTDIDKKALDMSHENSLKNDVLEYTKICLPSDISAKKTNLLIANILFSPLIDLKDTFDKLCFNKDATLLLTGVLKTQVDALKERYKNIFIDFETIYDGDWALVVAKR